MKNSIKYFIFITFLISISSFSQNENPKDQIARILTLFLQLPGMECSQKEILISALNLWKQAEIDFADAYIIKTYQHLKIKTVCSYDRHLQNHEIECFNPGSEC